MSFKLEPDGRVGAEFIRVIHEEITATVAVVGRQHVALKVRFHRARTATKRLRAAIKLIRGAAPHLSRRENRRLRDIARGFSVPRDADAMLDCLTALLQDSPGAIRAVQCARVRRALQHHRRAVQPLSAELKKHWRDFKAALRACDRRIGRSHLELKFESVAAELRRGYKRARKALRAARSAPNADTFHAWRKSAKTYSNQCRLLRAAWPPAMKELRDELRMLTGRLGDEHDLNVLETRLTRLYRKELLAIDASLFRTLIGLIDQRRNELRTEALPLGERLFAERPAVIEARMKAWWKVAGAAPHEATLR